MNFWEGAGYLRIWEIEKGLKWNWPIYGEILCLNNKWYGG